MPWVGFEPTISAGERPQTYALDRAATGTGSTFTVDFDNFIIVRLLLFITPQFPTNAQNIFHINQCTHGDISSKMSHPFIGPATLSKDLAGTKECVYVWSFNF